MRAGANGAGGKLIMLANIDPDGRIASPTDKQVLTTARFLRTFQGPRSNWRYGPEAGPGADGRAIFFPHGKALGGSSPINGHL